MLRQIPGKRKPHGAKPAALRPKRSETHPCPHNAPFRVRNRRSDGSYEGFDEGHNAHQQCRREHQIPGEVVFQSPP